MEPEPETEIEIEGMPKTRGFDIGVIELDPQSTVNKSFDMPFDGFTYVTIAGWSSGASNAIGFSLTAGGRVLIPTNKDVKYVTDNDASYPIPTIAKVFEGGSVTAEIRNEGTTEPLDLQIKVIVTNFDPRLLGGMV